MKKLVVLITCHNRKEKTNKCLEHLFLAELPPDISMHVVLLDDGSTDGTSELIEKKFPNVEIIQGDGNLYWAGGMRKLMDFCEGKDFDYYLWLNDDTYLFKKALAEMFSELNQMNVDSVLVGATQDPDNKSLTYGGFVRKFSWSPLHLKLAMPDPTKNLEVETINGNCVLIPESVFRKTGNLDSHYTHGLADLDFGFMIKKSGSKIFLTRKFVGTCKRNKELLLDKAKERLNHKMNVKNMPWEEWKYYVKKNGGIFWPYYLIAPYVKSVFKL